MQRIVVAAENSLLLLNFCTRLICPFIRDMMYPSIDILITALDSTVLWVFPFSDEAFFVVFCPSTTASANFIFVTRRHWNCHQVVGPEYQGGQNIEYTVQMRRPPSPPGSSQYALLLSTYSHNYGLPIECLNSLTPGILTYSVLSSTYINKFTLSVSSSAHWIPLNYLLHPVHMYSVDG